MGRPSSDDPIEPMDLADMRENGVRSLDVQCWQCRHRTVMNVDHLRGDLAVKSFEPRMRARTDVRPNWSGAKLKSPARPGSILASVAATCA
jgi:hypothetical protein